MNKTDYSLDLARIDGLSKEGRESCKPTNATMQILKKELLTHINDCCKGNIPICQGEPTHDEPGNSVDHYQRACLRYFVFCFFKGDVPNSRIDSLDMQEEQTDRVVPGFIHPWKMDQRINTSSEGS